MDERLGVLLQRLGQADRALRNHGEDPEPFLLLFADVGAVALRHPGWDNSWPLPTADDVDDLEELGYLRAKPAKNSAREFSLTVKGREQSAVLAQPTRIYAGGRAPPLTEVLEWLTDREAKSPELFDLPTRLIDEAVAENLIAETGREEFAKRIVALAEEGYLDGDIPYFEQASAEDRLEHSDGLRLTMKAHDRGRESPASAEGPSIAFYGSVVAGQIAAGDITNYTTFGDLLDAAQTELDKLTDLDVKEREEAGALLEVLRGRAVESTLQLTTGAGGILLATIIGRLIGLPL